MRARGGGAVTGSSGRPSRIVAVARRLRAWVPTSVWVAMLVQTVFMIVLAATDGFDFARHGEVLRIAFTYVTLLALFGFLHLIAPRESRTAVALAIVGLVLLVAFDFIEFETVGGFDYAFFHENVRELTKPLGRHIVGSRVKLHEVVLLVVLPIAFGIALLRRPSSAWSTSRRARAFGALGCAAFLVGAPVWGITTHESITTFAVQAIRFHTADDAADLAGAPPLPFVHEFVPSAEARALAGANAPRPHVILLFLESWSGIYADKAGADGRPVTPVFDRERRKGLTVEHFYGNSIQSSRGRFATLCGLVPVVRGKEFTDLGDVPFHCLPDVLAAAGYKTVLRSASDEPLFENSEEFFRHIGYAEVAFEDRAEREGNPAVWGAGLQDDAFYAKLFREIDEAIAADPEKPLFVTAINASNHYPFDADPRHAPLAEYPTKYARNYVASLRKQDAWLTDFFAELDRRPALSDAIVVLVGDHSFPADEHGIHFNGIGAYEESFRTGFALRWNGHVPPTTLDETSSQLDIAPTIADLLQLRHRSHFVGRSLVAPRAEPGVAQLVQPYDGVRLVAVSWPFKLMAHEAAHQEQLYDLSRDPDEETDRSSDPALATKRDALRSSIAEIRRSDAIVRAGRVWSGP